MSVDKPALLLGVGMAGSLDAGSTLVVELQVAEVEANDFSQQVRARWGGAFKPCCTQRRSPTVPWAVPLGWRLQISELASVAQSFAETAQIAKLMLPAPVRLEPGRTYMLSATINAVETACCEVCRQMHGCWQQWPHHPWGARWHCGCRGCQVPALLSNPLCGHCLSMHRSLNCSGPLLQDCLEVVVAQGIRVKFQPWESANGTSETRGNVRPACGSLHAVALPWCNPTPALPTACDDAPV